MGVEPSHSHDPGKELHEYIKNCPDHFQDIADDLIKWSKSLRKDRDLAFYGAKDYIPSENYSSEEGEELISFLQKVSQYLSSWGGR